MPIVNPDEEIREGYSHLSHIGSVTHRPDKHQEKSRVEDLGELASPHPHNNPDKNRNPANISPEQIDSKDLLDINLIKSFPEIMPQIPETQPNRHSGDSKGHSRNPGGSGMNLASSVTHFHILDIEVDQTNVGIDDDSLVGSNLDMSRNPKKKHVGVGSPKDRDSKEPDTKARGPLEGAEYDWGMMPRRQYKVGINLKTDWRVQASFFAKIMLIKAIQLAFINLWIFLVTLIPFLESEIIRLHNWFFLALGIFIVLLIGIRLIAHTRSNWHPATTTVGLIALTICIAYALASVTIKYDVYAIPTCTWILMLTCLLLALVPYLTQVPITDPSLPRTGGIIILLVSVIMLVISLYSTEDVDVTDFSIFVWLPSVIMSEAVLWVMICEIQRIVQGWSFHVSERRWYFASLYV